MFGQVHLKFDAVSLNWWPMESEHPGNQAVPDIPKGPVIYNTRADAAIYDLEKHYFTPSRIVRHM